MQSTPGRRPVPYTHLDVYKRQANMGFAEAVDCPVILIADIDRGGVFPHLVGRLDLLSASEQARVKGFVINHFRGDTGLLETCLLYTSRCV